MNALLLWFLFVSIVGIFTLPRDTSENKQVIDVLKWVVIIISLVLFISNIIRYENTKNPSKTKEKIEETNIKEEKSKDF